MAAITEQILADLWDRTVERDEARELADDLATMLDELVREPLEPAYDRLEVAAALVQRWHERVWADL
jgi:hypothetical protein